MKTKRQILETNLRKLIREEILSEEQLEPAAHRKLATVAKELSNVLVSIANSKNSMKDDSKKRTANIILKKLRSTSDLIEDAAELMSNFDRDSSDYSELGAPTSR